MKEKPPPRKRGNATPLAVREQVAMMKLSGKTWDEIEAETGLSNATIARLLKSDQTQQFMAEMRAAHSSKLAHAYDLILSTAIRDLEQAKDPVTASKLRNHLMKFVTGVASNKGGDRTIVNVDARHNELAPPPPEGRYTIRQLLDVIRQPEQVEATKEEIN